MQENGNDEPPPLVRLLTSVPEIRHTGLVGDAAHAAELAERAGLRAGGDGSSVGARPVGDAGIDDFLDVVHAGCEAGAHVDQSVWRGADHDVEVGPGLNG